MLKHKITRRACEAYNVWLESNNKSLFKKEKKIRLLTHVFLDEDCSKIL